MHRSAPAGGAAGAESVAVSTGSLVGGARRWEG